MALRRLSVSPRLQLHSFGRPSIIPFSSSFSSLTSSSLSACTSLSSATASSSSRLALLPLSSSLSLASRRVATRALCTKAAPEGDAPKNVPMVITAGRAAKTGVQWLLVLGLGAISITAGYFIVRELFPSAQSPNAIFNRASDILRNDPEVVTKFGEGVTFYGEDHGGRRAGRRFHIPDHSYEKNGTTYTRVRFTVEGKRGLKGIAYAEVSSDDKDFTYLIIQVANSTRDVLHVIDNREPEKPRAVRQSELMMELQTRRSVFYGNGPQHAMSRQQEKELGDSFSYVKYVRCDRYPDECTAAGALDIPSWKIDGTIVPGFQTLEQLENIVATKSKKKGFGLW